MLRNTSAHRRAFHYEFKRGAFHSKTARALIIFNSRRVRYFFVCLAQILSDVSGRKGTFHGALGASSIRAICLFLKASKSLSHFPGRRLFPHNYRTIIIRPEKYCILCLHLCARKDSSLWTKKKKDDWLNGSRPLKVLQGQRISCMNDAEDANKLFNRFNTSKAPSTRRLIAVYQNCLTLPLASFDELCTKIS